MSGAGLNPHTSSAVRVLGQYRVHFLVQRISHLYVLQVLEFTGRSFFDETALSRLTLRA